MALEEALSSLAQTSFDTLVGPADEKEQRAAEQGKIMEDQSKWKITMDGDETTIKGPSDAIAKFHRQIQEGAQLKHHVSQVEQVLQGELQKVQNRENAYNRSPILSALANIAGNMAQAPKMPGVVQALGRSSVQLNPGPLAIQGQKMNILEALDQAHRTSVADERADFNQNLQLAEFGERVRETDVKQQELRQQRLQAVDDRLSQRAADPKTEKFDSTTGDRELLRAGVTDPEERKAMLAGYAETHRRNRIAYLAGLDTEEDAKTRHAVDRAKKEEEAKSPIIEGREKRVAAASKADAEQKTIARETRQQANKKALQNSKIGEPDKGALMAAADFSDIVAKDIRPILDAHPEWIGPENLIKPINKIQNMTNSERQKLQTAFNDLRAKLVQMNREGVRGFQQAGMEYNKQQIPAMGDALQEALGKLKYWDSEVPRKTGIIRKYYKAFGTDIPDLSVEDEPSGPLKTKQLPNGTIVIDDPRYK